MKEEENSRPAQNTKKNIPCYAVDLEDMCSRDKREREGDKGRNEEKHKDRPHAQCTPFTLPAVAAAGLLPAPPFLPSPSPSSPAINVFINAI
jgi:hypothetical protein